MTILDDAQTRAPTTAIREFLRNSISLSDVLGQIWTGRLVVVAALVFGLAYGLLEAHRAGPTFVAMISIMPADADAGGGGGGGGGAIGMLASLAGGGGGGGGVPKFQQFLSSIGSVGVAEALNRKYDMVCVINRGICDPSTHIWKKRTGWRAAFNAFLARVAGLPDNDALTVVDLAQFNNSAIVVTRDKTTGLSKLSFYSSDPKFAADYLTKVLTTTNNYVRDQDRASQRTYVDYVARRISTNTNVEQRQALSSLLLQQERRLMMTEADAPYAATILDGPTVLPVNNVLRIVLMEGFLFMAMGIMLVLFRNLVPERFRFWSRIWPRS